VIGAGDFIGSEIAKKFASEGFTIYAGRRNGEKLAPLVAEIEKADGKIVARSLDARKEEEIVSFLSDADKHAPLDTCIFNIGANVNFPIVDTTERVFRKVWEMACYSGFLAGREAARVMLPRGRGNIFFTGATAWVRERLKEREGQAALDNLDPDWLMPPASVAESYWQLHEQPRSAWVFEQEIRPFGEKW
jgi:NAD(P)-dependent dehydrogenase (short-subunit alcohol dehydrogenase family)